MYKPMTQQLRTKIHLYIKERMDISELIKDVSLRGESLSGGIIKKFVRINDDLTDTDFSYCIFGEEQGEDIQISNCRARSNFKGIRVLSKFIFRGNDARRANFIEAYLPYAEWQGSDLRGAKFCGVIICLGSVQMRGALFDDSFFENLGKALDLSITVQPRGDKS